MSLTEGEVYLGAKRILKEHDWRVLAGQPPSGLNHLPAVEIKWEDREGIGSKGALRPDLIAAQEPKLMLVECKPTFHQGDADKLRSILADPVRIDALLGEMSLRGIFQRGGLPAEHDIWREDVCGALAYSQSVRTQEDLWTILVEDRDGTGELLPPGTNL